MAKHSSSDVSKPETDAPATSLVERLKEVSAFFKYPKAFPPGSKMREMIDAVDDAQGEIERLQAALSGAVEAINDPQNSNLQPDGHTLTAWALLAKG